MLRKSFSIVALAVVLFVGALVSLPFASQALSQTDALIQPDIELQTAEEAPAPILTSAGQVYQQVAPSVVAIVTYGRQRSITMSEEIPFGFPDPFFFFSPFPQVPQQRGNQGPRPDLVPLGSGSGFVVTTNGHIVTNAHVIEGAARIEVNFLDGTIARAEVVGVDESSDIAVLRVDVDPDLLQPVTFADSDQLLIGERVLAIGSPFGQRWTLTEGIISALDRSISSLTAFSIGGVIQTDAAINPGNSGGPLLNMQGHVIGVNSQISTRSGSFSGIGYAVPSNLVRSVAERLIEDGRVEYSFLGISGSDVSLSIIEQFNLPANFRGVVVSGITVNSPADRAGLRPAGQPIVADGLLVPETVDIITHINDRRLNSIADLIKYLATETAPGDQVTLTVLRNGTETLTLDVTLTQRPN
jgi:S1-C subfamily serine protease